MDDSEITRVRIGDILRLEPTGDLEWEVDYTSWGGLGPVKLVLKLRDTPENRERWEKLQEDAYSRR